MRAVDLAPSTITLNLFMLYSVTRDEKGQVVDRIGRQLEPITMQLLSRHEWEQIGFGVPDPIPPRTKDDKPDYESMRYRTEKAQAETERNYRRLARALSCAGGLEFDSADDDLEGRAAELRHIDAGIFSALLDQLAAAATVYQRKVTDIADSFRGLDT